MGRGRSKAAGKGAVVNQQTQVDQLDSTLIRRANAASFAFDSGSAVQRQFERDVNEIRSFDLSEKEQADAISKLRSLTESQLKAEASAVSPMVSGRARLNVAQVNRNADKAVDARQKTNAFMDDLRKSDKAKRKTKEAKSFNDAFVAAYNSGVLEFSYGGSTYRRSSTRSKTFTKV